MTHTAGRELDALVAEKVMGCQVRLGGDGPNCNCPSKDGYGQPHSDHLLHDCHSHSGLNCDHFALAYYSTDIAAAWQVVERLKSYGYLFPEVHDNHAQHKCCIWMNKRSGEYGWLAKEYASTAPLAICLAALKCVEKLI